jgi:flagellar FliL protein
MLLVGLPLGGAILGGLVAGLVIAPRVIGRSAAVADSTGGHGAEPAPAIAPSDRKVLELTNIIVNPAGSQGSRFLMTTVAFSVPGDEAYQILESHKIEVRDGVTSILESRTLAQLTAPGARDSLKVQIAALAATLVGPAVPVQVYLPQFVIQ